MGELEILVNGERVFSHKESGTTPSTAELLEMIRTRM
jgi:predicted Rdx family selenoprotein